MCLRDTLLEGKDNDKINYYKWLSINAEYNVKIGWAKSGMLIGVGRKLIAVFDELNGSVVILSIWIQKENCVIIFGYLNNKKSLSKLNKLYSKQRKCYNWFYCYWWF